MLRISTSFGLNDSFVDVMELAIVGMNNMLYVDFKEMKA